MKGEASQEISSHFEVCGNPKECPENTKIDPGVNKATSDPVGSSPHENDFRPVCIVQQITPAAMFLDAAQLLPVMIALP
jgi:hypothetical protein